MAQVPKLYSISTFCLRPIPRFQCRRFPSPIEHKRQLCNSPVLFRSPRSLQSRSAQRAPDSSKIPFGAQRGQGQSLPTGAQWEDLEHAERAFKRRLLIAKYSVVAIIAGCTVVYGIHWVSATEARRGNSAAQKRIQAFYKYMVLSRKNVEEGRWYTILTSTFAHQQLWHLGFNMLALWGFGRTVIMIYGLRAFSVLWVGSAVTGGVAQLYHQKTIHQDNGAVGASGALFGVATALACAAPGMRVELFMVPMSLAQLTLVYAVGSIACMHQGWLPGIGHADHLGGMAFGVLSWLFVLRRGRLPKGKFVWR